MAYVQKSCLTVLMKLPWDPSFCWFSDNLWCPWLLLLHPDLVLCLCVFVLTLLTCLLEMPPCFRLCLSMFSSHQVVLVFSLLHWLLHHSHLCWLLCFVNLLKCQHFSATHSQSSRFSPSVNSFTLKTSLTLCMLQPSNTGWFSWLQIYMKDRQRTW